jgi:hypothetical protein
VFSRRDQFRMRTNQTQQTFGQRVRDRPGVKARRRTSHQYSVEVSRGTWPDSGCLLPASSGRAACEPRYVSLSIARVLDVLVCIATVQRTNERRSLFVVVAPRACFFIIFLIPNYR